MTEEVQSSHDSQGRCGVVFHLDVDEWAPYMFFTSDPSRYRITLTPAERADYDRVLGEFTAWQTRLEEVYRAEQGRRRRI